MIYYLYPHGGSSNHGCEAIVRSTAKLLDGEHLKLYSSRPDQDYYVGLDSVSEIFNERKRINPFSLSYLISLLKYRIFKDFNAYERLSFSPILKSITKDDVLLSIGGDNYCYGEPSYIYFLNKEIRKRGIKTVLWGCSIEPESMHGEMLRDLSGYTHIFARECITYNALLSNGITQISLFPDPAFQLDRVDLPLPNGFIEGNTIGINVSPMVIDKELSEGIVLQNFVYLINYILENTTMQVALIPHVVWSFDDDRKPLSVLYESFKNTGRVVLLDNHNAEELKGFIGRCRFMVAARTHASIAAYSQQVPTLVVGYSVKARGIAKDVFGTWDNYVLPVQSLKQRNVLLNAFRWLLDHEEHIRLHYSSFIPSFNLKALAAAEELKRV